MPHGMIGAPPFMPPNGMGMPGLMGPQGMPMGGQRGPQGMPMGGQMPPHPPMMPAFPPMPPSPPQAPQQQGGPQQGGPQQPDPWAGGINPSLTALLPPPGAGPNPGFSPPAMGAYGAPEPFAFQPPIQPTPIATGGGVGYHWPPTTAGVPIDPGALIGIPIAKGPDGVEELLPAEATLSPWRPVAQQTPIVSPATIRPTAVDTAQQPAPQPVQQSAPQLVQQQATELAQQQATELAQQQAAQLAQLQAAQLVQLQAAQLAQLQAAQLAQLQAAQLAPAPTAAPSFPAPTALIPAASPSRPSLPPAPPVAAYPTDGSYSTKKSWHARKNF